MQLLIVTAVAEEAKAIGAVDGATVVVGGIGRTNAAAATTEAILGGGRYDAVLSAGIGGALPGSKLSIGDAVVASRCVYCEEGLVTDAGFVDLAAMGFSLGDFDGNAVPVGATLLDTLSAVLAVAPIATVATCSGTDAAAAMVARRTGASVEAMEGAAVVHAARRMRIPAIELRVISNFTGDRSRQAWDLTLALTRLGEAVRRCAALL